MNKLEYKNIPNIFKAVKIHKRDDETLMKIKWDVLCSIKQFTDPTSRVYFITVNDKIFKIGGSEDAGGLRGTLWSYAKGQTGCMSIRSFGINFLIRKEINKGNTVEMWCIILPSLKIKINGFNNKITKKEISISFRDFEKTYVEEYKTLMGDAPCWNFVDRKSDCWPKSIVTKFNKAKLEKDNRVKKRL